MTKHVLHRDVGTYSLVGQAVPLRKLNTEKSERRRLVKLAIAAIWHGQPLDYADKVHITALLKTLLPIARGAKIVSSSERAKKWLRNPVHLAAHTAELLERDWRACGQVRNNRVEVDGKLVPIHREAAKRAIEQCQRHGRQPFKADIDQVIDLLRRGRASPF